MTETPDAWYARPVFFVADGEASLKFYASLGFRESWRVEEGGRILVVQVARNDVELILNRRDERTGGGRLFFSLTAEQAAACFADVAAAGITFRDGYWGMPIKALSDADGNELFFAFESADDPSPAG